LEAEIQKEFPDADVRLIESAGGVFEVMCQDTLVFSKRDLGRHAHPGEVLALLRPLINP
jgi:selT/selW/selH-like putative selenoprotein